MIPYSIHRQAFLMEDHGVYCEVRT